MIYDFSGRFLSAFGYVPGSLIGKAVDSYIPLNVEAMTDDPLFTDQVELRYDAAHSYLFAFRTLAEEYANVFATPPMFSFNRSKKLIETQIDNSDMEVVERYATGAYEITWRGLLIDMENHRFPLDKMEKLNEIFEINGEWSVYSQLLNKLKIDTIYFKEVSIEPVEGYEDTVSYEFRTKAIKPVEWQLTQK